MSQFLVIFATVFVAELGDKTQLASLLFAADRDNHPILVFLAAATALIASTALAVCLGALVERHIAIIPLKLVAGIGFVAIGLWTVWDHFRA